MKIGQIDEKKGTLGSSMKIALLIHFGFPSRAVAIAVKKLPIASKIF
ncbi:hypothetical protein [Peribacillus sp. SCS-155]